MSSEPLGPTAEEITRGAKSNLALARLCLPAERRQDLTIVYAFCRVVDDVADDEGLPLSERLRALEHWDRVIEGDAPARSPLERQLVELRSRLGISAEPFHDLIEGCRMDFTAQRFGTWEDLRGYTYRVAGAVGLICLPVFGAECPQSRDYALALGDALQLTNILRDVGEDLAMGHRIYLPLHDLARFQYTERDLLGRVYDGRFVALMQYEAERARGLFEQAERLLPAGDFRALTAPRVMHHLYRRLLEKMAKDGFQVFRRRYRLSAPEKLYHLIRQPLRNVRPSG